MSLKQSFNCQHTIFPRPVHEGKNQINWQQCLSDVKEYMGGSLTFGTHKKNPHKKKKLSHKLKRPRSRAQILMFQQTGNVQCKYWVTHWILALRSGHSWGKSGSLAGCYEWRVTGWVWNWQQRAWVTKWSGWVGVCWRARLSSNHETKATGKFEQKQIYTKEKLELYSLHPNN